MSDDHIRHALRSERAAGDLTACAAWAARHRLHLVLDHHVARRFTFLDEYLPPGTVNARESDALAVATADPTALLVTAGGHYWGAPVTHHRDWATFAMLPRTWAVLVVSALSGVYYGLHVKGLHVERFVDETCEEFRGIDASIELIDGTVATVVRTTVGVRLERGGTTTFSRDLGEALMSIDRPVVRIHAPSYERSTLATFVERADVLPDGSIVLNDDIWYRTPALKPGAPGIER